jgi:hypothetical protein
MKVHGWTSGIWAAALLAVAACTGGVVGSDTGAGVVVAVDVVGAAAAKGNGVIACSTPEHDWGAVMEGQEVSHTFVVKNVGDGVLRILNARGG